MSRRTLEYDCDYCGHTDRSPHRPPHPILKHCVSCGAIVKATVINESL